jgi:tripartite-type tricarboxylate transporter receptor subunit TctC
LPAFDYNLWIGLFGPAGMPPDLASRVNADVQKALALPDVRERLTGLGAEPMPMTAPEFRKFVRDEIQVSEKIVKAAGIKAQ